MTLIGPIPADPAVRRTVARWCVAEWAHEFPDDTEQTYLDLFALADRDRDALPVVLVAWSGDNVAGTATLVDDDELPDAHEPGPWLAAVFVDPARRGRGLGGALVAAAESEAARLGVDELFLYTPDAHRWYEARGWECVRAASLGGRAVTVMRRTLARQTNTGGQR